MPAAGYKANNHYQPPATLHQDTSQPSSEKYSGSTAGASAISFSISLVTVTETDRPLAGPRLPQLMPSAILDQHADADDRFSSGEPSVVAVDDRSPSDLHLTRDQNCIVTAAGAPAVVDERRSRHVDGSVNDGVAVAADVVLLRVIDRAVGHEEHARPGAVGGGLEYGVASPGDVVSQKWRTQSTWRP